MIMPVLRVYRNFTQAVETEIGRHSVFKRNHKHAEPSMKRKRKERNVLIFQRFEVPLAYAYA